MKKKLIFLVGIALSFCFSCEDDESLNSNLGPETSENLVELTMYVDGEKTSVHKNLASGNLFVLKGDDYVALSELSDDGQIVYYINAELKDFLIFTSKAKMQSIIDNSDQYAKLRDNIKVDDPSFIKDIPTKGASVNSGTPSVTIATAHSFGGFTFTKSLPYSSTYGNPQLRCNQYETDCINFNDQISSLKVTQGVYAEFYKGSFDNTGSQLFVDGRINAIQVNNLQDIGWNDQITSFWATSSGSTTVFLSLFPGLYGCSHNYDDPSCP